jgi:hypothetical protein
MLSGNRDTLPDRPRRCLALFLDVAVAGTRASRTENRSTSPRGATGGEDIIFAVRPRLKKESGLFVWCVVIQHPLAHISYSLVLPLTIARLAVQGHPPGQSFFAKPSIILPVLRTGWSLAEDVYSFVVFL